MSQHLNDTENIVTDQRVSEWWDTAITHIQPNHIGLRGYPIEELIEQGTFVETIWLLLKGELPEPSQVRLLEAALVSSVDHGPQAPSIAAARMAATTGVGLNNAVATGINLLGDVHGGAGQQCVDLLHRIRELATANGIEIEAAAQLVVDEYKAEKNFIPGFGHRFHQRDPRRAPLLGLVASQVDKGTFEGWALRAGLAIESALAKDPSKSIPMNIDGATAVIYAELGFSPDLARGLFVLSRGVGILAHAFEESTSGARIKGPIPKSYLAAYSGPGERHVPERRDASVE
ncbi:MAG: citryl-CoA lyase [Micrococcaceae bacterium]